MTIIMMLSACPGSHAWRQDDPSFWKQVQRNLTLFRSKVIADVLLGKGTGLTGHSRYNLYPPAARCPPGRPRKRYGGKSSTIGHPDPVTWDDAQAASDQGNFIQRQQAADGVKYFCDLGPKSLPAPCVIFSMGSEGDFSFEAAVLKVGFTVSL
jgi:Methyltransferase domain